MRNCARGAKAFNHYEGSPRLLCTRHALDEPFYQIRANRDFFPTKHDGNQNYCGYWDDPEAEIFAEIFHALRLV